MRINMHQKSHKTYKIYLLAKVKIGCLKGQSQESVKTEKNVMPSAVL